MIITVSFITLIVCLTLVLLRLEQRWPRLLRRSCLLCSGIGVVIVAMGVLGLWLFPLTRSSLHLHPQLWSFLIPTYYYLPGVAAVFLALGLLTGTALFCSFCLRRLRGRRRI